MEHSSFLYKQNAANVLNTKDRLLERCSVCLRNQYCLETLVITHSILENYTFVLLNRLRIPYKSADRIFQCMEYVRCQLADEEKSKNRYQKSNKVHFSHDLRRELIKDLIDSGILDRIHDWRSERNKIIHDVAVIETNQELLQKLAENGLELIMEYTDIVESILKNVVD